MFIAMDDVFRALADPTRRELLDELQREDGQTLTALESRLPMTRFGVMKHLKVLEEAGLVVSRRRGREKLHFLNPVPIRQVHDRWVSKYAEPWASALTGLKHELEEEGTTMEKVFEIYIKTTPERLWQAITDPKFTSRYWGVELTSDWQVGSTVTWEYKGVTMADPSQTVLVADVNRRLAYTWHAITPEFGELIGSSPEEVAALAAEQRSNVSFEIEPIRNSVSRSTGVSVARLVTPVAASVNVDPCSTATTAQA